MAKPSLGVVRRRLFAGLTFLSIVPFYVSPARAQIYKIDPTRSSVAFKIKHLFGDVHGGFNVFSGTITFVADEPKAWKVEAVLDAASIDTQNADRDRHLRNQDFFDVEKFPEIRFISRKLTAGEGGLWRLEGDLAMHGRKNPVILELTVRSTSAKEASFSAKAKINRVEWGIVWNKAFDAGSLLIGEEVHLLFDITAVALPYSAGNLTSPTRGRQSR